MLWEMETAKLREFPFVAKLPKGGKGRVARLMDVLAELERVTNEKGPVMPQALAADILGVSTQRVGQILDDGRLQGVQVGRCRFVIVSSFKEFAKEERKTGRPPKVLGKYEAVAKAGYHGGREVMRAAYGPEDE
jgi:hypothetical protein